MTLELLSSKFANLAAFILVKWKSYSSKSFLTNMLSQCSKHFKLVEEEHPRASRRVVERLHTENFASWLAKYVSLKIWHTFCLTFIISTK